MALRRRTRHLQTQNQQKAKRKSSTSSRTVRLDEEDEEALTLITQSTGLSILGALKQGLLTLKDQVASRGQQTPYDIYASLDLGDGGEAIAPSTETRRGVQDAIRRKLNR